MKEMDFFVWELAMGNYHNGLPETNFKYVKKNLLTFQRYRIKNYHLEKLPEKSLHRGKRKGFSNAIVCQSVQQIVVNV